MSLSTYTVLFNTERVLYPWRESIKSALPVADQVIINVCHDRQEEWDLLNEFLDSLPDVEREKILVLKGVWGATSNVIAELQNDCLKYVTSDWALSLQADEVLHEDGYKELAWLQRQSNFTAAKVRFTHFAANFDTEFSFVYQSVIRLCKMGYNWVNLGDGVELGQGQGHVWNSHIYLQHFGKVDIGRKREAATKEFEFQQMFVHLNIGFPDPKVVKAYEAGTLDYNEILSETKIHGDFRPFTGTHAKAVLPYIKRMKEKEDVEQIASNRMD